MTARNTAPPTLAPMIMYRRTSALSSAGGGEVGEGSGIIVKAISVVVASSPALVNAVLMSATVIEPEARLSATVASAVPIYGLPRAMIKAKTIWKVNSGSVKAFRLQGLGLNSSGSRVKGCGFIG